MRILSTAKLVGIVGVVACLAMAACSGADEPPSEVNNNNSGGSGSVSGSGSGSSVGTGGDITFSTGGIDATGGIQACEDQTEPAKLTPVNLVFMIDKSGSMGAQDIDGDGFYDGPNEWDNTEARWNPVRDALIAFFENPGSTGLMASLEFFPQGGQPDAPDTGVCKIAEYSRPSVTLRSLDEQTDREALISRLERTTPDGGTPTLPALQGAIEYARTTMLENPGSQSVVVFVTDGQPGVARVEDGEYFNEKCFCYAEPDCPYEDEIPYAVEAAQNARDSDPSILTYVIGMGEADLGAMDDIALAGSNQPAFIVSLEDPAATQQTFTDALSSIRSVQAPCELVIPEPPPGDTFDKLKVNVDFVTGNDETITLTYAGNLASELGGTQFSCPADGAANPWYWTYDDEETPTKIVLCPSACSATQGDAGGRVNVKYGCTTVVTIR